MEFNYRFIGESAAVSTANTMQMSFAPDVLRKPTFFTGKLSKHIAFREAISALHDVVVSDLRFKVKDKTAYKEWAERQLTLDLAEISKAAEELKKQARTLGSELENLKRASTKRMGPWFTARTKYFQYLFQHDRDTWIILDPVITVHPDELFFECFSKDESTYGRLSCSYNVFKEIGEFSCGTTNIDYSSNLYNEFQKIRTYKDTRFEIDPKGFSVQTGHDEKANEVKIDLPESWVRGFLQVSAAMSLPLIEVKLHPMDIHNFCFILRQRKEKNGPRSMRYILKPGQPVEVIFEPWNTRVTCSRSIFEGKDAHEIRVWGRRRLHILERLIPVTQQFKLYLLDTGLPSFYVADLGDMTFTLGLSGWTANDWSRCGNFDLMAPQGNVDTITKKHIFNALKENWFESSDSLAKRLNLDRKIISQALFQYVQTGLVLFDLSQNVFRIREWTRDPLPMDQLRFSNSREQEAEELISQHTVTIKKKSEDPKGNLTLEGVVNEKLKTYQPSLTLNADEAIIKGKCTCSYYIRNKLFRGPCSHIIALKMQHNRTLNRRWFEF